MKKEKYFISQNIDQQSRNFLKAVMPFRSRHPWNLNPRQCALLVLDMQSYFLDPRSHAFIPSAPAIVPRILALQQLCLQRHIPVVHSCHVNTDIDAGQMKSWWQDLITFDHPGVGIIDELKCLSTHLLPKTQYDAFYNTDLEVILKQKNISQIVVSGVMTHLCCETTARSAFVRGFEVFFGIDLTATYRAVFHRATLINLAHGFAIPLLAEEISRELA